MHAAAQEVRAQTEVWEAEEEQRQKDGATAVDPRDLPVFDTTASGAPLPHSDRASQFYEGSQFGPGDDRYAGKVPGVLAPTFAGPNFSALLGKDGKEGQNQGQGKERKVRPQLVSRAGGFFFAQALSDRDACAPSPQAQATGPAPTATNAPVTPKWLIGQLCGTGSGGNALRTRVEQQMLQTGFRGGRTDFLRAAVSEVYQWRDLSTSHSTNWSQYPPQRGGGSAPPAKATRGEGQKDGEEKEGAQQQQQQQPRISPSAGSPWQDMQLSLHFQSKSLLSQPNVTAPPIPTVTGLDGLQQHFNVVVPCPRRVPGTIQKNEPWQWGTPAGSPNQGDNTVMAQ